MISLWNPRRMKAARTARGLMSKEAAKLLNITPEYLSMVESGSRTPSQKLIAAMADVYRKDVTEFLRPQKKLPSS